MRKPQNEFSEKRNFACFGDSITSEQVTGIGSEICAFLGMRKTGNFAVGYATCSDWHDGEQNLTPFSLIEPQDTNTADNVLSNQIYRCLQYTGERGMPIAWHHPQDGDFSVPGAIGLGHTDEIPDVLYIAIGINDGNQPYNKVQDDTDAVLRQRYGELTRISMASALRWALETLRCAYPKAEIFVASPLYTYSENAHMTVEAVEEKRSIIRRICEFETVHFIDSTRESGFTVSVAKDNGGVHPNPLWKEKIARFVAEIISEKMRKQ